MSRPIEIWYCPIKNQFYLFRQMLDGRWMNTDNPDWWICTKHPHRELGTQAEFICDLEPWPVKIDKDAYSCRFYSPTLDGSYIERKSSEFHSTFSPKRPKRLFAGILSDQKRDISGSHIPPARYRYSEDELPTALFGSDD